MRPHKDEIERNCLRCSAEKQETKRQLDRYLAVARAVRPAGDLSESREVAELAARQRQDARALERVLASARRWRQEGHQAGAATERGELLLAVAGEVERLAGVSPQGEE